MSRSSKVQQQLREPEGALDTAVAEMETETEAESSGAGEKNDTPATPLTTTTPGSELNRKDRVRAAAYAAAEARGFEPGHEVEDWLEAEAQVGADEGNQG